MMLIVLGAGFHWSMEHGKEIHPEILSLVRVSESIPTPLY